MYCEVQEAQIQCTEEICNLEFPYFVPNCEKEAVWQWKGGRQARQTDQSDVYWLHQQKRSVGGVMRKWTWDEARIRSLSKICGMLLQIQELGWPTAAVQGSCSKTPESLPVAFTQLSLGRTWSDLAQQLQACFNTALNLMKALASV